MKTLTTCFNCNKFIRESEAYKIKLTRFIASPNNDGIFFEATNKVKFCRTCTKKAGYKVKSGKPVKKKDIKKINPPNF